MRINFHRWLTLLAFVVGLGGAQTVGAPAPAGNPITSATPTPAPAPVVKAPAPLRIAVDPHAAPLIFKTGEKYSGLEAEFARGLGESLGRPVVFVEAAPTNLIPALLDDKADFIMSGLSVTKLREVRVAFCDPYVRTGQVALCRRGDLSIYANNANLENLRAVVGVVTGSSGEVLAGSDFAFATRKSFPTLTDAVRALLDKNLDLIIADYPLALWQSAENEATVAVVQTQLTQEFLAWAVRKDDDALRLAANAYLAQLKKSGKLTELLRKWLPDVTDDAIAPTLPPATPQAPAPATTAPAAKPPTASAAPMSVPNNS